MDHLSRKVLGFIRRWSLLERGDSLVLGFSGGPDSVALARLLLELSTDGELPLELCLAHVNHSLRGAESDREEAFCREFAGEYGLGLRVHRADVAADARASGRSVEAAAREIRYAFLGRIAAEQEARAVATAHHADDVAETVLLRLIRGASVTGLGGIAPGRPLSASQPDVQLVRPLMETRKADLLEFLRARGQAFCTDSSNTDTGYMRNRIRHRLIPMLEDEFPAFSVASLCALNESAVETSRLLDGLVDALWRGLCTHAGADEVAFDAQAFAEAAPPLRKASAARALEILAQPEPPPALAAEHYAALSALGGREVGVEVSLPRRFLARREHGLVYFTRRRPVSRPAERELPVPGSVELPEIGMSLSSEVLPAGAVGPEEAAGMASERLVHLDLDALGLPLKVRARRDGDRFRPLGSPAPTRLKSFLIARRVPRHLRDGIPLVLTSQGDIAWVVGHEIGECYKLSDGEHAVLRLRSEPLGADRM